MIYIFDETADVTKLIRHCNEQGIKKIFLCPVTTDEDKISFVFTELSKSGKYQTEVLPYLKYFDETAFSERENFVKFVSKLANTPIFGDKNLKQYFKYPHSEFSAWWLSSIVEKDPLKSDTYHNLIRLLTVIRLRKERSAKNIILDTALGRLSSAITDNAKGLGYKCKNFRAQSRKPEIVSIGINFLKALKFYIWLICKIIIVAFYTRGLGFRKKILEKARFAAITYFPLVDKEALKQKIFIDRYYNSLQAALENKHKDKFVWFAMDSDIGNLSFRKRVKLGRRINLWNYPIFFIEEWVNPRDLFPIFMHYLLFAFKFVRKMAHLSKNIRYSESRIDIWRILEDDWFSSFVGSRLMSGIIYYTAFRNIAKKLKRDSIITYLAENKAWERALNYALKEAKGAKSLAIVHTSVPLLVLEFFDSPDDIINMPNPDFLACNGKIPLRLFKKSGWSDKRAFLWFALRYQHLKKHLENRIPWQARRNKVLVALSYSASESGELLRYVYQAFRAEKDYEVIIKGHYALSMNSLIKNLGLKFNEKDFIFTDEPVEKLLPLAKAMIVTGSSASLDSIAFACPVIIPKLSNVVDMNPLSGISDFPIYTWSPKELKGVVDDIIDKKEPLFNHDKCKNFVEDYFEFFDSDEELLERIEKL